jgi:hypothetical protein
VLFLRQASREKDGLSASLFSPTQLYKIHDSNSTKICFGRPPMLFRIYSRSWRSTEVIWGPTTVSTEIERSSWLSNPLPLRFGTAVHRN